MPPSVLLRGKESITECKHINGWIPTQIQDEVIELALTYVVQS